jgi:hypothetical protein
LSEDLIAFGEFLRKARSDLDLSYEEVEKKTRIRAKFLQAFEAGIPDPALSEAQIRGFLRNYALLLRLDADQVLANFDQARLRANKRRWFRPKTHIPAAPADAPKTVLTPAIQTQTLPAVPTARRTLRTLIWGVLALVFAGMIAVGGWLIYRQVTWQPDPNPAENPPLATNALGGLNITELTFTPTPPLPSPLPTSGGLSLPPLNTTDGLVLFINVQARSWVEIQADGVLQYRGILRPGVGVQYEGRESIRLRTSNAGGLEISLNNQPLGVLGGQGELYEQTFTRGSLSTPTPAPTWTPTPTLEIPAGSAPLATPGGGEVFVAPTGLVTALPSPSALPSDTPIGGGILISTVPPTPIPPPATFSLESPTPTVTLTPTITVTPTPFLPARATRTPRP